MGEYLSDKSGQQVCKIGIMDNLRCIRRDELIWWEPFDGKNGTDVGGLLGDTNSLYRFPFPDEDGQANAAGYFDWDEINDRREERTILITVTPEWLRQVDHGERYFAMSPTGSVGYNVNFWTPCLYSADFALRHSQNVTDAYALINVYGERYDDQGRARTIFRCAWCDCPFSLNEEEIEFVRERAPEAIRDRLKARISDSQTIPSAPVKPALKAKPRPSERLIAFMKVRTIAENPYILNPSEKIAQIMKLGYDREESQALMESDLTSQMVEAYTEIMRDAAVDIPSALQGVNRAKVAQGLLSASQTIQKKIDHLRRARDWNPTHRRAEQERQDREEARRLELVKDKMEALAAGFASGNVHPLLVKVTSRTLVERLVRIPFLPGAGEELDRFSKAKISDEFQYSLARALLLCMGSDTAGQKSEADKLAEMERNLIGLKIAGFFPTPSEVVDEMISLAQIVSFSDSILEPSAGSGAIADRVRAAFPDNHLTCIELVSRLVDILKAKAHGRNQPGSHMVLSMDFMEHTNQYDVILMNPPFEKGQDMDHVRHAYTLLRPGGRLVAIMSPSTFFLSSKKAQEWRSWFEQVNGEIVRDLPSGTFKTTGVASKLVMIRKES